MKNKFVVLSLLALMSCKKEDTSPGNYIIGFENSKTIRYGVQVLIDDQTKANFFVQPNTIGISTGRCDDLVSAANASNVVVITQVPPGKHTVKIRDINTQFIYISTGFNMNSSGCTSQQMAF